MSTAAPQALRKMRIISVPLTRPTRHPPSTDKNAKRILTYYQFQISASKPASTGMSTSSSGWLPEEGIANWITKKAGNTWAGFGKAKGGWKLKTYQMGERLVDRMDFEELALKSIDPSLGPSIKHPGGGHALEGKGKEKGKESVASSASEKGEDSLVIPLLYPPSQTSSSAALAHLRQYVEHRMPKHRRGFYTWMILTPFTAPFMIIPIIPNLPFFFCVWRSWSHYRAYKSSQYLQNLLENSVIVPEGSEVLDGIYKEFSSASSSSSTSTTSNTDPISNAQPASLSDTNPNSPSPPPSNSPPNPNPNPPHHQHKHTLLLTRDAVPLILAKFGLKESAAGADLYRAVEQARVRVESGRLEL
ncbi:uncharacterized protein LACBIDRAFT_308599 [Laccaria bicolor S238N-H82]|uniref:Predicted protein n=1 Tax=Laccaria bicolor (strain S238N-H82 / ATCC MYA-4686) TaxID=486041 RepID=B0CWR4_LACBS|nr:uncharacterized protein LACBIDRAFT_308599 [Laccaria bicolor S238N-H82]EDR13552.1 predicted protein [Laccaria bicolor S238N-H82]|eukprot:XP_001876050.1 predicted protein [Laccaria bicolor S238N-H82]